MHRPAVIVEEVIALRSCARPARIWSPARPCRAGPDRLADDLFRQPLAIGRRRVDQADALVDRGLDRRDRFCLVRAAPHPAADRPCAEADRRGVDAGRADLADRSSHATCCRSSIASSTELAVSSSTTSESRNRPLSTALDRRHLFRCRPRRRWCAGTSPVPPARARPAASSADSRRPRRPRGSDARGTRRARRS